MSSLGCDNEFSGKIGQHLVSTDVTGYTSQTAWTPMLMPSENRFTESDWIVFLDIETCSVFNHRYVFHKINI